MSDQGSDKTTVEQCQCGRAIEYCHYSYGCSAKISDDVRNLFARALRESRKRQRSLRGYLHPSHYEDLNAR